MYINLLVLSTSRSLGDMIYSDSFPNMMRWVDWVDQLDFGARDWQATYPGCCLESSSTRGYILKMSLEKLHYDFYLASLLDLEALQTKCRFTTRRDTLYVVRHAAIAFFQYISHCTDSNLCDNLWHMTWLVNMSRSDILVYRSSPLRKVTGT